LIEEVAPLEPEDLLALRLAGATGIAGSLRVKHHRIAQLAAASAPAGEIAEILGLTVDTVETLLASRSMRELVSEYGLETAEDTKLLRRAKLAAFSGVQELHRRIETEPEALSTKILADVTFGLMDRTGAGQKISVTLGVFTMSDLERLRKEDRIIDVSLELAPEVRPALPESVAEAHSVH
jgi:hypothetical protein